MGVENVSGEAMLGADFARLSIWEAGKWIARGEHQRRAVDSPETA